MTFDLDAYLKRLGNPTLGNGAETLAALQQAQMQFITFENIDVLLGNIPALDIASLQQKLVHQQRGGYCLEVNTLFARALQELGFTVTPFLGRIRRDAAAFGARTHYALIVQADEQDWLCDTGFGGGGSPVPLSLTNRAPVEVNDIGFRLVHDDNDGETVLETNTNGDWSALYGFDQAPISEKEYEAANFLCARWPHSPFPDNLMMTRLKEYGRLNLFNCKGKRLTAQGAEEFTLTSQDELARLLKDEYVLDLDEATVQKVWQRISNKTDV